VLLPSAHAIEREFRVIEALRAADVPVPVAYLSCDDPSIIGTPFYVMSFVDGRLFSDPTLPGVAPAERAAMYDAMNDVLARLHSVDWKALGLDDFGKPEGYVRRQIERWWKQYEASKTEPIEAMDALVRWLLERVPERDETAIAHGDYRPGNILFHPTEPRVVAVLDWELSTLGHPIGDLAYNCMAYRLPPSQGELSGLLGADVRGLGIPTEEEYLATYARRTGRAAVEGFEYFMAFALFRIAAICQGVYKRGLMGNASDAKAMMFGKVAIQIADLAWRGVAR
jgi:aminoglycoside phosphotransferase (APT) family kinase protein